MLEQAVSPGAGYSGSSPQAGPPSLAYSLADVGKGLDRQEGGIWKMFPMGLRCLVTSLWLRGRDPVDRWGLCQREGFGNQRCLIMEGPLI